MAVEITYAHIEFTTDDGTVLDWTSKRTNHTVDTLSDRLRRFADAIDQAAQNTEEA